MADRPELDIPPTGASASELIDLERRIAERGLQLRRIPPGPYRVGTNAVSLSPYEEILIRSALLAVVSLGVSGG